MPKAALGLITNSAASTQSKTLIVHVLTFSGPAMLASGQFALANKAVQIPLGTHPTLLR